MTDDHREEGPMTEATTFRDTLRRRAYPIGLIVGLAVIGAAVSPALFPDVATSVAALGGAFLGAFTALCAAAYKFFD